MSQARSGPAQVNCIVATPSYTKHHCDASSRSVPAAVHTWLMGRAALGRKVVERVGFPEPTVDSLALMPARSPADGEESLQLIMNHTRGQQTRYCRDAPSTSNKIRHWCIRPTPAGSGISEVSQQSETCSKKLSQETVLVFWEKNAIALCSKKRWTADDSSQVRVDIATSKWSLRTTRPLSRECLKRRWHNELFRKRHVNSSRS